MTRADFLAAILANPSDDDTRLVFADWLSDHEEEERAELIRLQCKLANGCKVCDGTGRNAVSPCSCSLARRRERSLLDLHGPRWLLDEILKPSSLWQADNPHLLYPVHEGDWRRGFIEALAMPWQTWQAKGEQLTLATPLREVILTDIVRIDAAMQPLLASPLGRLSVLKLKGHPSTVPILEGVLKEKFPSLSVETI